MANWEDLQKELKEFFDNVYFQPPSNTTMKYPCIVFNKNGKSRRFGNDKIYFVKQGYQIMVIEKTADSTKADDIERHFQYCAIGQYYTVDNLHHTTLNLYY